MALTLLATNNAESTLASAISETDTSLIVSAGTGAKFPEIVNGENYFKLTIIDAATGSLVEIVNVVGKVDDIFTIERGQEGTIPRAWLANDFVANMMTAETINFVSEVVQQSSESAEIAQNAADSATEAAESATKTLASTVKQSITFTTGGVLNSTLDRVSDGKFLYYWTGEYPVTVPPGSSVESSGGINIGAWACDTDLLFRQNLESSEAHTPGTSLSGHAQGKYRGALNIFLEKTYYYSTPGAGFSSLKECCEYVSSNDALAAVQLPPGDLRVSGLIYVSNGFRLIGSGIGLTNIIQEDGDFDGVFYHTINDVSKTFCYRDLTIKTERKFSSSNRAIVFDARSLVSGVEITKRNKRRGEISNVEIGNDDRGDNIGFGVCIDLISMGWMALTDLTLKGCSSTPSPDDDPDYIASYDMHGIGILQRGDGKPVETKINGLWAYNLEHGYLCPEYAEGTYFTDLHVVNCKYGVTVTPIEEWIIGNLGQVGCYQFTFKSCHFNVSIGAVFLSGSRYCSGSQLFLILDDHKQTDSLFGLHLRNGGFNTFTEINAEFYNVDLKSGVNRQLVILNNSSDNKFFGVNGKTASTTYENITNVFRYVNGATRNRIFGLEGINVDTAMSIAEGCGQNSMTGYRFINTTTPVDDQAGDFNRGNADGQRVTFTPTEGAPSYTITITPREYFTRRPNGVSACITNPSTLSFPVDVFYDFGNSAATAVVLIVKPVASGNTLPAVQFGISVNMKD
ncbi:hypothetical protein [Klebsiella oxytoca]|uniref:tail fiber/spike domain-containing protein n=1 Tax=Klebsiella oxytoca TaxID=571 RepID=UPI00254E62CD|nr:hypothetical protein [Klebsiella oxytoca]MDK6509581.1 hypothetical protein [Klebsiella oxytoca]MDK8026507.1 hypothetical protein [Klebsiella oxytoca]